MKAVNVTAAARELGESPGTVRRWVRQGCPVASRGSRGRGRALLLDPEAVRQWRAATTGEALLLSIASAIPGVLADAMAESLRLAQGLDKRRLAGVLAGAWYLGASALLDHLRERCDQVPHVGDVLPAQIQALRKIARE
jgi:hypothetical protein